MFYPEGLVDFALEKTFIPQLPFFLLHRCVQKWLFSKYCPHFSFITLVRLVSFNSMYMHNEITIKMSSLLTPECHSSTHAATSV